MRTLKFFDYHIYCDDIRQLANQFNNSQKTIINTINPHSFYVADKDIMFKSALASSNVLLPDGIGIVYANLLINGKIIKKIAGLDLFLFLLAEMEQSQFEIQKRVFFLGSTENVLNQIKQKINDEYPSLKVEYFSPPYKEIFTEEENSLMANKINHFKPFVLFVGMTAPKQEKWVFQNFSHIESSFICSVGAVFDFYSGRLKRPNIVWQSMGLEWLRRFSKEPLRLWKRNFISMPYFLVQVVKELISRK